MKKKLFTIALMVVCCSLAAQTNGADILYLRDGTIVSGKILKETRGYSIEIQRGGMIDTYRVTDINRIERNPTENAYGNMTENSYPNATYNSRPEPHYARTYVSAPIYISNAARNSGISLRPNRTSAREEEDFYPQLESYPPHKIENNQYSQQSFDYSRSETVHPIKKQNVQQQEEDAVYLKDGVLIKGTIVNLDTYVQIKSKTNGLMYNYPLREILYIQRTSR